MTNFISSPPQVPSAYALSERSSQKEILEMLASFVSAVSVAVSKRASFLLAPYSYNTGMLYVKATGFPREVLSVSASITLSSGIQSIPILSQISSVISISGGAEGGGDFFPLQYNSLTQSLSVYFSNGSIIVTSSGLSGLILTVFILYV